MENKEMLRVTLKLIMAVIQLILSAVSLAFCIKLLTDACKNGGDSDKKIIFLDF